MDFCVGWLVVDITLLTVGLAGGIKGLVVVSADLV